MKTGPEKQTQSQFSLRSILKIQLNPINDPDWKKHYSALIKDLKESPTAFNMRECHDAVGVYADYTGFTRNITSFGFEKASKVIDYIFDKNIIAQTLSQRGELDLDEHYAMFHGMREFLEVEDRELALSLEQLPGAYQLWRRSVSIPGDYVKAAIFIERDMAANVLKVEMLQKFQPREQKAPNPVRGRQEALSGYIFRQSDGRYIMILRQNGRKHLRVSFFTEAAHFQSDDGKIGNVDWMRGQVMGLDNNKSMSANVYMERVSDETRASGDAAVQQLLESTNVYSPADVPGNVMKILTISAGNST